MDMVGERCDHGDGEWVVGRSAFKQPQLSRPSVVVIKVRTGTVLANRPTYAVSHHPVQVSLCHNELEVNQMTT